MGKLQREKTWTQFTICYEPLRYWTKSRIAVVIGNRLFAKLFNPFIIRSYQIQNNEWLITFITGQTHLKYFGYLPMYSWPDHNCFSVGLKQLVNFSLWMFFSDKTTEYSLVNMRYSIIMDLSSHCNVYDMLQKWLDHWILV